ncbi:MAG: hypothetical protein Kow0042_28110 [Calditrichia bacterium]
MPMETTKKAPKKTKETGSKPKPEEITQQAKTQEKKSASTDDKLKEIGDKIISTADKGVQFAKEMFEKAKHFSVETTELTRLRIEIRKLRNRQDNIYREMGKKLWEMKKNETFQKIRAKFEGEFKQLEELEAEISEKEKQIQNISAK